MPAARRAVAASLVWRRGDRALLLAVATLAAFGLVMVFSASEVQGWLWFHNAAYYFERQLLWLTLGVILLWAAAHVDYHRLRPLAMPLGLLSVGLLSGGYGEDELTRAGAFRVYRDAEELRGSLDGLGVLQ